MSHLASISIQNLRNITAVTVDPSPTVNVLYGKNGSGKTSFLEAIHLLGLGRSFRTRHASRLIQYNQPSFVLHAKLDYGVSVVPIGLEKKQTGHALFAHLRRCTLMHLLFVIRRMAQLM